MFATRPGILNLLKDGGRHFSGLEEATLRNIEACGKLCEVIRTSLGPNRMNKLIVNHLDKLFVTSDAETILEQLDVQHPAAKLLVYAANMQEQEYGDATNLVITFGGELLHQAEILLKEGLSVADIVKGYEIAMEKTISLLNDCVCYRISSLNDVDELKKAIHSSVVSKTLGSMESLPRFIAEAVMMSTSGDVSNLNVENIRVAKLTGGGLQFQSMVIHGMVIQRNVSGSIACKENCKVMVLGGGLELPSTETKGTVLLTSGDQLLNYSIGEEQKIEKTIREIRDAGVEVIIAGGSINDLVQYFCDKYEILTLKITSKFELRRLCQTLGAASLLRLGTPTPEEMGFAESIKVEEIASKKVTLVKSRDSRIATILLRGATTNVLDELERTIDDGIRCVRNLVHDNRFVAGGGACEMELASQLEEYGKTLSGLEQYAVLKFANAFECIVRTLTENAGLHSTQVITTLYALHKQGQQTMGLDITLDDMNSSKVVDVVKGCDPVIIDHLKTKECALQLATQAAMTILRIDQIIMARPAGGPKPPQQNANWDEN